MFKQMTCWCFDFSCFDIITFSQTATFSVKILQLRFHKRFICLCWYFVILQLWSFQKYKNNSIPDWEQDKIKKTELIKVLWWSSLFLFYVLKLVPASVALRSQVSCHKVPPYLEQPPQSAGVLSHCGIFSQMCWSTII